MTDTIKRLREQLAAAVPSMNLKPLDSPSGAHTKDAPILLDPAEREEPGILMTPSGFVGPRGRGDGNFPAYIPAGMPPVQVGGDRLDLVPKNATTPEVPPQLQAFWFQSATASGVQLDRDAGFPIRSIMVDNYSSVWLFVEPAQAFVPPQTVGWSRATPSAPNTIKVKAEAPPGFTQPPLLSGGVFSIVCIESDLYSNAGGTPLEEDIGAGQGSITGTTTNVASSVTAGTLLAANTNRKQVIISNDSTAKLYILFGPGTVSATLYTYVIPAGGTFEGLTDDKGDIDTRIITGVWSAANGTAGVTELV